MIVREEIIGDCRLILGDCLSVLPLLGPIDLCLADPPYGVDLQTQNSGRSNRPYQKAGDIKRTVTTTEHKFGAIIGDDEPFDPVPFLGFQNAVLWGANNYADRLPPSHCWFSWDKKCGKAAASDIGDCELAWVRGLPFKTVRAFRHMWAGFQRDSEVGGKRFHPTQKPIALMAWCLEFFPKASVVLDPFMGSGTTGVACVKAGRAFIGIEKDERYFDIACARIRAAYAQPDMFVAAPAPQPEQLSILDGAA